MRTKHLLSLVLIMMLAMSTSWAQNLKIGYANIELVLLYMPETESMNQQLRTYEQQLAKRLQTKEQYLTQLYEDYQAMVQQVPAPDEASVKTKQDEIIKIEEDYRKAQADAQQKLGEKRQTLMEPIATKLETQIKALAAAEGYDMILNTVDAGGVSIVLFGPPEDDLTEKLMKRLGIEVPTASGK
ncbi:MAG: OmpH family outer membrane protein [Bacteroidia bacterium]